MISAVLFDLDETLFDRSASVRSFVRQQFAGSGIGRFPSVTDLCNRFMELDARGSMPKIEVYGTLIEEMGGHRDELRQALFDDYEANAWRHAVPFDGMRPLLSWLRQNGRKIGIVSNGQTHIQLRSLLALNLDRMVDAYLISEEEACRKPEAEIFERAANRLDVRTSDCIFVGDSPQADMAGARAAGMKTIWFPNGASWPSDYAWRPDATVASLWEVQAVVKRWEHS
ncbi:HAD family hydrolase [Paracoccus onubensis]|uniref:HAD family hydrolase n=1 Tax=Paracoccus onubensis TaxID=1675788 RepID=UPI0027307B64|nr:HAD family hydrolase [Paracoccus onubensis]MDP0929898.1 HAD family hydrolase [Paracoccus onubensis]